MAANDMNEMMGVTKAQEAAMLAGSMFGWSVPAANPRNYDEKAIPSSRKTKITKDRRNGAWRVNIN
jgi:hypothetical protein